MWPWPGGYDGYWQCCCWDWGAFGFCSFHAMLSHSVYLHCLGSCLWELFLGALIPAELFTADKSSGLYRTGKQGPVSNNTVSWILFIFFRWKSQGNTWSWGQGSSIWIVWCMIYGRCIRRLISRWGNETGAFPAREGFCSPNSEGQEDKPCKMYKVTVFLWFFPSARWRVLVRFIAVSFLVACKL